MTSPVTDRKFLSRATTNAAFPPRARACPCLLLEPCGRRYCIAYQSPLELQFRWKTPRASPIDLNHGSPAPDRLAPRACFTELRISPFQLGVNNYQHDFAEA